MHPTLAEEILKSCRKRERQGDHPSDAPPKGEMMEDCVIELGRQRDEAQRLALVTLAEAFKKFAPDLARELAVRWERALAKQDAALADLLAAIGPSSNSQPSNG